MDPKDVPTPTKTYNTHTHTHMHTYMHTRTHTCTHTHTHTHAHTHSPFGGFQRIPKAKKKTGTREAENDETKNRRRL